MADWKSADYIFFLEHHDQAHLQNKFIEEFCDPANTNIFLEGIYH